MALAMVAGTADADPDNTYLEKDGIVLFNTEDAQTVEGWELKTELPGFRGTGYLEWRGPNYFPSSGAGNGIIAYHFRVATAGNYQLRLRNHIAEGTSNTESNDSWIRLATGVDIPGEQALNGWTKVYTNTGGQWSWASQTVDHAGVAVRQYLAEGDHTIEISGRSRGHAIDMIALYRYEDVNYNTSLVNRWELSEVSTGDGTVVTPGEYPEPEEEAPEIQNPRENLELADASWVEITDNTCVGSTLALAAIDSAVFNRTDAELTYRTAEQLQISDGDDIALLKFDLSSVPPFSSLDIEYGTNNISADGNIEYSLASHSQWFASTEEELTDAESANADMNEYAPYSMLSLGSASGGWTDNTRHRSSLTPILIGGSTNTIMMQSRSDSETIGLYSHLEPDNVPRLLLSGDENFCSDWQANIEAAALIVIPGSEKDSAIEVVRKGEYTEPSVGKSRGSLSTSGFLILLLMCLARIRPSLRFHPTIPSDA